MHATDACMNVIYACMLSDAWWWWLCPWLKADIASVFLFMAWHMGPFTSLFIILTFFFFIIWGSLFQHINCSSIYIWKIEEKYLFLFMAYGDPIPPPYRAHLTTTNTESQTWLPCHCPICMFTYKCMRVDWCMHACWLIHICMLIDPFMHICWLMHSCKHVDWCM